jgi:hypothetical protein
MILSKFQVGIAAAMAFVIAAGFAWEIRENGQLRSETVRQSKSETASLAGLEKQLALESQRLAAAEANVATLLKAAKAAGSTRGTVLPGANATIDTDDAAKAATTRGKQLIKEGKLQEALDGYLTCYRELQAIRPGSAGCQSLMSAIKSLGRTYPQALVSLASLRDSAMAQWQAQPGRRELPFEIALLNDRLGEGSRTLALYDSLPPDDIQRGTLVMIARSSFIEARRYADALIGKPFGQMLNLIELGSPQLANLDASLQAMGRRAIIDETVTNVEVLTGAGKFEDARMLSEKLLGFDNSDATQAALKQHVERAQAPRE